MRMKRRYKKVILWIVVTIEFAMMFAVIVLRWSKPSRLGSGLPRPGISSIRDADAGRQTPQDRW
jgi:hypothetical protein